MIEAHLKVRSFKVLAGLDWNERVFAVISWFKHNDCFLLFFLKTHKSFGLSVITFQCTPRYVKKNKTDYYCEVCKHELYVFIVAFNDTIPGISKVQTKGQLLYMGWLHLVRGFLEFSYMYFIYKKLFVYNLWSSLFWSLHLTNYYSADIFFSTCFLDSFSYSFLVFWLLFTLPDFFY